MTDSESASQRSDTPSSANPPDGTSAPGAPGGDPRDEPHDENAHGDTEPDAERNASPTPSRPGAGRSHVDKPSPDQGSEDGENAKGTDASGTDAKGTDAAGTDAESPTAEAKAPQARTSDEEDIEHDSDVEHEVFILTPDVMRSWAWTGARWLTVTVGSYYLLCTLLIISYRWVDPPTTGVQLQRSISAWWDGDADYKTIYRPVPLASIDDDLELAVVAAEDTRFFQHTGIDWEAIGEAVEDNRERGFVYRGGSTMTQQLAKNLFQTTHSSFLRKGMEVPLTYLLEIFLPKERILELYLNVIEWGPGVFGVEAAVQHHYGHSAAVLSRYRAAALAACIPNPLVRTPGRMPRYTRTILGRMYQLERIEPRFAT